jgi:hypothetical protein
MADAFQDDVRDVPDVENVRAATAEQVLANRRRRRNATIRSFLDLTDADHVARLREAALLHALSLPERREDEEFELVHQVDAAFLPATLPDAYADLLDALRLVRRLRFAVLAHRKGNPEAARAAYAALESGDLASTCP